MGTLSYNMKFTVMTMNVACGRHGGEWCGNLLAESGFASFLVATAKPEFDLASTQGNDALEPKLFDLDPASCTAIGDLGCCGTGVMTLIQMSNSDGFSTVLRASTVMMQMMVVAMMQMASLFGGDGAADGLPPGMGAQSQQLLGGCIGEVSVAISAKLGAAKDRCASGALCPALFTLEHDEESVCSSSANQSALLIQRIGAVDGTWQVSPALAFVLLFVAQY